MSVAVRFAVRRSSDAELVAVAIALVFLREPVRASLLVGAALIVAGGIALARERVRPEDFRRLGVLFALAGLFFGLSYAALFEAYYRGRVSVVAPLVATESLWGVAFSALLLRRSELVGRKLVLGAALIVGGGVLIGASR